MSAQANGVLKIPQDVIDDVISQTDIVQIIGEHLKLKRQGRDYVALCPFHKESSPSFSVSPVRQFFYCFGCGAGGNALQFLKEYQGRSFLSVLQDFADDARVDLTPFLKSAQNDLLAIKIMPALNETRLFFARELKEPGKGNDQARQYLARRAITPQIIEQFSLGYAGYGKRIVEHLQPHQEPLVEAGVLGNGETGIYSLFRDRIMMPVRDTRGKTIALAGRALADDVKPKYRNTMETPHFSKNNVLYGLYESLQVAQKDRLERLIVVEGQFDVMAVLMAGISACAPMGSSVSEQQLRLLLRYADRVTLVFDGDSAGRKAMLGVCTLLMENLTDEQTLFDVVVMPEGKDPHNIITEGSAGEFERHLERSQHWLDAFIQHFVDTFGLADSRARSELASAALEVIHGARDPLLRHQALEKLAAATDLPLTALQERLVSFPVSRSAQAKPVQLINDASVRLSRILWDETHLAKQMPHPQLWVDEGEDLTSTLGLWVLDCQAGVHDAQPAEGESLNRAPASALGRMLGTLNPQVMQSIMQNEPEKGAGLALSLAWHITAICAGQAMNKLQSKAALGQMDESDRESFTQLMAIRRDAQRRTRCISEK